MSLFPRDVYKRQYLTFDDGPSPNTPRIIDILNENGVKATFFVKNGGKYNGYMKNITEAGNQISLHSYSCLLYTSHQKGIYGR